MLVRKLIHLKLTRGLGGGGGKGLSPRSRFFKKKESNKMEAFPYFIFFFFAFWQGSPNPQNYELAP